MRGLESEGFQILQGSEIVGVIEQGVQTVRGSESEWFNCIKV